MNIEELHKLMIKHANLRANIVFEEIKCEGCDGVDYWFKKIQSKSKNSEEIRVHIEIHDKDCEKAVIKVLAYLEEFIVVDTNGLCINQTKDTIISLETFEIELNRLLKQNPD